ncbi:MAG: hypothetical protein GXP54_10565, partial [Deltaproteobacteria bacterium]|nr:hypothetical protein [Deltaproteobacteria bacterium]
DRFANSDLADPLKDFAGNVGREHVMNMVRAYREWDASRVYRPFLRSAVDRIVLSI